MYTNGNISPAAFSNSLKITLSSYTRGIQKQERRTGSLFQQRSKKKEVLTDEYAEVCFHYIHQNPVKSYLVEKMEDWKYSSFNEYWKDEQGVCDIEAGRSLIPLKDFYKDCYHALERSKTRW